MSISINDVKVGGVYATASNQERRVLEIANGQVSYESRSGNIGGDWSPGHTKTKPPSLDKFAEDCDRIVSMYFPYPEEWQNEVEVTSMRYQPAIQKEIYVLRVFRLADRPNGLWSYEVAGGCQMSGMSGLNSREEAQERAVGAANTLAEMQLKRPISGLTIL